MRKGSLCRKAPLEFLRRCIAGTKKQRRTGVAPLHQRSPHGSEPSPKLEQLNTWYDLIPKTEQLSCFFSSDQVHLCS